MTMRRPSPPAPSRGRTAARRLILRLLAAGALGVAAALLVSCGSSATKLIPAANAGPLQSDFEAVAQAAQSGNGNCTETSAAILKTEQDFTALPSSVDTGLRNTLSQGISNLHKHALELCRQPLAQPTTPTTTTTPKTTTTPPTTTPTDTQTTTTPTTTTPTSTATTPTTSSPGGGTPAPEREASPEGGGTKPGESPGNPSGGAGQGGGK
jgi:hypothetical protein